ncbi:MAG: hypothetical protein WCX82_00375 [archaeon]|jgi:hypothetical protein
MRTIKFSRIRIARNFKNTKSIGVTLLMILFIFTMFVSKGLYAHRFEVVTTKSNDNSGEDRFEKNKVNTDKFIYTDYSLDDDSFGLIEDDTDVFDLLLPDDDYYPDEVSPR